MEKLALSGLISFCVGLSSWHVISFILAKLGYDIKFTAKKAGAISTIFAVVITVSVIFVQNFVNTPSPAQVAIQTISQTAFQTDEKPTNINDFQKEYYPGVTSFAK